MVKLIKKMYNFVIKIIGKEMFMYLLFGFLTTAINFIVYYICNIIFKISAGVSTTIAFIAGVIFAYITNRIYVFKSKSKQIIKEIITFSCSRLFTLGLEMLITWFFITYLKLNTKTLVSIITVITQIIVIVFN